MAKGKNRKGGKPRQRIRRRLLDVNPFCHYCKQRLTMDSATLDHIIPLSKGGQSGYMNLVLCCKSCNGSKGDKDYLEFVRLLNTKGV